MLHLGTTRATPRLRRDDKSQQESMCSTIPNGPACKTAESLLPVSKWSTHHSTFCKAVLVVQYTAATALPALWNQCQSGPTRKCMDGTMVERHRRVPTVGWHTCTLSLLIVVVTTINYYHYYQLTLLWLLLLFMQGRRCSPATSASWRCCQALYTPYRGMVWSTHWMRPMLGPRGVTLRGQGNSCRLAVSASEPRVIAKVLISCIRRSSRRRSSQPYIPHMTQPEMKACKGHFAFR